jgi:two-component system, OmpR family, KDP operon response regulator KdpE
MCAMLAAHSEPKPDVLIVDDNDVLRTVVRMTLNAHGYRCLEASNGREALSVLAHDPVPLVILDVQMAVMNGIEFLEVLRGSDAPQPYVVACSAGGPEARRAILAAGADDYLAKPFVVSDALAALRRGADGRDSGLTASERPAAPGPGKP